MNNKVLVKIIAFSFDKDFDCFLPIKEKIFNIKKIVLKYLLDKNEISEDEINSYILANVRTNIIYNNDDRIGNTDIRNCSEILLLKIN